ncbi:MAG: hypothetical protein J5537_11725 [Lachnospiraceae bacterium]|nr:hypothetical protein [Lachnospiraceae bacterium]
MLKNKRVVKALTIGLATVLATPSMTAFAAAPGEMPTSDDKNTDVTVEVKEPVVVASENEQAIKDASKLTDDAQKAEQKVFGEAVSSMNPFDPAWDAKLGDVAFDESNDFIQPEFQPEFPYVSFVDPDNSANEFDDNAGDHLDDASDILDKGEEDLTEKLGEFEEKIEAVDEATGKANDAQGHATAEAMNAEEAEKKANATTDIPAVQAQAGVASTAATNAASYAEDAQTEATNAYNYFVEARDKYEAAETIAKNANEAADKAVAEGLEDAEEAVKFAKQAEEDAKALKKEMDAALFKAKGTEVYYQGELFRIEKRLKDLASEKKQLDKDYAYAHDMYDKETEAWRDAFDAVSEARQALAEAPSQWEIIGDTLKVQALEKALIAAEKVLWADGKDFHDAKTKADSLKIKKELQDAYDLIKEAYEGKLEENQELKDAVQNDINVIDGKISDLKEKYGDNIGDIQATLLSDESTEEAKEAAVKNLINNITSLDSAERFETTLFEGVLYKVTDADGKTQFYTYEIRDGVIYVAKVTETVENKIEYIISTIEPTYTDYNTKEELEAAIAAGLLDGTYYYDEVAGVITDSRPTGKYNVTYTENEYKRGYSDTYDVVGQAGKVVVYNRVKYGMFIDTETHTFNVKYMANPSTGVVGWQFYYDEDEYYNTWYPLTYYNMTVLFPNLVNAKNTNDVLSHIYLNNIEVTVNDVYEGSLYWYQNKTNYSATAIYADTEVPTTVYKLVSNVKSKTGSDKQAIIDEVGEDKVLKIVETTTPASHTVTEETVVDVYTGASTNHFYNGRREAPELNEDGSIKYYCAFTIGEKYGEYTYSTANGDLRWENNSWQVFRYDSKKGKYVWKNITAWWTDNNLSSHVVKEYKNFTTMSVEEAAKIKNAKGKVTRVVETVIDVPESTTYTVYYKGTDSVPTPTPVTTYTTGDFAGIDSLSSLNKDKSDKNEELGTVVDYNTAKKAYDDAKSEMDAAWKKFVDAKKREIFIGIELWKAKKELNEAIAAKNKAEDDLAKAQWNFYWQDLKTAGAKAALDDVTGKLAYNAGATAYNKAAEKEVTKKLQEAKAKVGEYTYKARVAKTLATDAKKARKAAEKARDAIKNIKASNLGADALEAAYAELELAEKAYQEAQKAADLAKEEAAAAKKAYENILARIKTLQSSGGTSESGTESDITGAPTVFAGVTTDVIPGNPAAPAVGGAGVAVNVAPAAADTTTELATPQTALAATVPEDNKSDDGLATILPQGPALAADIADTEHLTWWWLLVVAVLGGTGYAMYRKFQAKKEEKVTK